jgi:hypothetical protein
MSTHTDNPNNDPTIAQAITAVVIGTCRHCGQLSTIEADAQLLTRLQAWTADPDRPYVQDSFPDLSADLREQIISGIHPACWDKIFPGGDDEAPDPPSCSICDGFGHGYPGAGPCPLEERGWEDQLEEERRYGRC